MERSKYLRKFKPGSPSIPLLAGISWQRTSIFGTLWLMAVMDTTFTIGENSTPLSISPSATFSKTLTGLRTLSGLLYVILWKRNIFCLLFSFFSNKYFVTQWVSHFFLNFSYGVKPSVSSSAFKRLLHPQVLL